MQAGLVLLGCAVATTVGSRVSAAQLTLIALLALAMGGQNATVRRLAVPDLTTTVLTLTVTGLVADSTRAAVRTRRVMSVLAMLAGALAGGLLFRWVGHAAPLWLAATLLVTVAGYVHWASHRADSQEWAAS